MNNKSIFLSIIIPAKNEERYINQLLDCLVKQHLPFNYEIIVADASSNDKTVSIVKSYVSLLSNVKVIKGGLPAIGRNAGAKVSKGKVLLFLDADCQLLNYELIQMAVNKLVNTRSELATVLLSIRGNLWIRLIYFMCNIAIRLSRFDKPFAVGGFILITKDAFNRVGGFNEELMHCEDYFLSREVSASRFTIVNEYVYTDDRRFKKMGRMSMVMYFIKNIWNRNNIEYFKRDIKYWQ